MKAGLQLAKASGKLSETLYRKYNKPETTNYHYSGVKSALGEFWDFHFSLSDKKFKAADLEWWKNWIEKDWTNVKEYISEYYDCDNYAYYFSARTAWLYNVNTALVAYGDIYDANNKDEKVGRHAFNILFVKGGALHCFEPMSDEMVKIENANDIIIGDWKYVPDWILGF